MRKHDKILLLIRTVRHLKPIQLWFQVKYRLKKYDLPKKLPQSVNQSFTPWEGKTFGAPSTSDGLNFRFLGERGRLETQKDWNCGSKSKLWLYNAHYLNDISFLAPALEQAQAKLVARWVVQNPADGRGNGWEPYTASLRIVNIVKWLSRQEKPDQQVLDSLGQQARFLLSRIEYHILGNHVFANAKALIFAGSYLQGSFAHSLLKKGLRILDDEIKKQFLADGAHFELSPMYHAALLWDVCDLLALSENVKLTELQHRREQWQSVLVSGLRWLEGVLHPDANIPFFNDASFGIAPRWDDLKDYANQVLEQDFDLRSASSDIEVRFHEQSGLHAVAWSRNDKAIIDTGPIGPNYQPGHAHADSLSFELSVGGHRLFVNSGTSQYGLGAERERQRGTAAHNTVEINAENSSEVWSGFRVGRRATTKVKSILREPDRFQICAFHDGYKHIAGNPIHEREWIASRRTLIVKDTISCATTQNTSHLYLHPSVLLESKGDSSLVATLPNGEKIQIEYENCETLEVEKSSWHPEFGSSIPNQCIRTTFSKSLKLIVRW